MRLQSFQIDFGGYITADGYDELSPDETLGTETSLSLSKIPMSEPDMPSGHALDAFVDGYQMRYVDAPSILTEYTYNPALNRIEFSASGTSGTWYYARYRTIEEADPAAAEVTTIFSDTVLDQDRVSTIVDKSGRNTIAFDIALSVPDGYSFAAEGTLKVIAGNSASLDGDDALDIPQWMVEADGYVKLELETGFTHIGLFYDYVSDDGYNETVTASVAVS